MAALGIGYNLQMLSWSQSQQNLTYKLLEHPCVCGGEGWGGGGGKKHQAAVETQWWQWTSDHYTPARYTHMPQWNQ